MRTPQLLTGSTKPNDRLNVIYLFPLEKKNNEATKRNLQQLHVDSTGREGTAGRDSTPVSSPASHFKRAHRRLPKTLSSGAEGKTHT